MATTAARVNFPFWLAGLSSAQLHPEKGSGQRRHFGKVGKVCPACFASALAVADSMLTASHVRRLVEALEDYEGGDPDAYSDVSAENSLLSGGHKRRVSATAHLTYQQAQLADRQQTALPEA